MPTAKEDAELLMGTVLDIAEQLLAKNREFFPIGGGMKPNDEIVDFAAYDGREQPPSQDVIDMLRKGLQEGAIAGEYKATAIAYDVRATDPETGTKTDAIAIALDHRDDYSVVVFFPYAFAGDDLQFGTTFAQRGECKIFGGD
jgi:hypothetical protein